MGTWTRLASVVLVLAGAACGLAAAAAMRVGAFGCPGQIPLFEDGKLVGATIYDCAAPHASGWGLLRGAALGAAVPLAAMRYDLWRRRG